MLKRKIIIKNKKKHHHHHDKKHQKKQQQQQQQQRQAIDITEGSPGSEENDTVNQSAEGENGPPPDIIPQNDSVDDISGNEQQIGNGDIPHPLMLQHRQGSKDSTQDDEGYNKTLKR